MQQFTSYGIFVYSVHKTFQFNAIIYKKMVLRTTMKDTFLSKLVIKLLSIWFFQMICRFVCVVWMMVCTEHQTLKSSDICFSLQCVCGHCTHLTDTGLNAIWSLHISTLKVKVSKIKGDFTAFWWTVLLDRSELVLFCSIAGFQRFARRHNKSVKTADVRS